MFPPEVKEGLMIRLQAPDGRTFPAKIAKVTDEEVTLDLNHPLAGKSLNFTIILVEIIV